jgi:segregation and condensation protein B
LDHLADTENINEPQRENSLENRVAEQFIDEISSAVEALLFASPVPLSESQLGRLVGKDKRHIPGIIAELNNRYMATGRTFRIEKYGEGFRMYTISDYDKYISRLAEVPRPARLSRAALEVLSIVAYRQPVIKSEIEKIRGIDSDGVIRTLLEKGFVAICGKSDGPGRPMLYKTTPEFLEFFGIADLSELPQPDIDISEIGGVQTLTLIRPPEPTPEPAPSDSLDETE